MQHYFLLFCFIGLILDIDSLKIINSNIKKQVVGALLISTTTFQPISPSHAKDPLPELSKCFNAVRKELSPEGESLKRISNDIDSGNWDDLKLFTREYDAGFRGGVLKSAWKQLGNKKQDGITISNSFTFDLIALNKAARNTDKDQAKEGLKLVTQDLENFLKLEKEIK